MTTGSGGMAGTWAARRWTMERFGVSPGKLPRRILNPHAPRVFCVSIPKSGTHLLERALCLHPLLYRKVLPTVSDENLARWGGLLRLSGKIRPGQVVCSHLRFRERYPTDLDVNHVRGLFMVRNPRDLVVSQIHYVTKRSDHRLHDLFSALPDAKAKLRLAIAGDPEHNLPSIGQRLGYFEGWLHTDLQVVRFEDLVGEAGGGDAARQRDTLRSIFEHLGVDAGPERLDAVSGRLFSTESPTFRKGAIGESKDYFDDELEELFRNSIGDRAAPYGYTV